MTEKDKKPLEQETESILEFEDAKEMTIGQANRKATRPEASFSNPSPFKIFETRFGKLKRSDREAKATKSVGPRAAPTAIQAAKGRLSHKE